MTAVLYQRLQDTVPGNSVSTDCGVWGLLFLLLEVSFRIIGTEQQSRFSPRMFNLSNPFYHRSPVY